MNLNHAVINRNEVQTIEKLLSESGHPECHKMFWKEDLINLRSNPATYWNKFVVLIPENARTQEEKDRLDTIRFMQNYYKQNPTPDNEQLELF